MVMSCVLNREWPTISHYSQTFVGSFLHQTDTFRTIGHTAYVFFVHWLYWNIHIRFPADYRFHFDVMIFSLNQLPKKIKSLERYFFAFLLWNFFKNGMERERAWEWKLSFYIKRQTQYRKYESYDLNERCSDFRSDAIVIPITKMRCFCMRNETIA